ncbi:MAG TPA: DUF3467 domain-containing protein [Chloroflexi bacterium]|jgi:hypothetical protein|nr:DUF3467 domain-containing protein [Anaerolineaceae bacterium]HHX09209.1 DUF3467 domain-containing protein [Chloroflexota bacterium]
MADIKRIQVEIPENLEPRYVNVAYITHTAHEFLLDFVTMLPGLVKPKVNTRLILSPLGMKLLQRALNENIKRYETAFGEIKIPQGGTLAEELFKGTGSPIEPEEEK